MKNTVTNKSFNTNYFVREEEPFNDTFVEDITSFI